MFLIILWYAKAQPALCQAPFLLWVITCCPQRLELGKREAKQRGPSLLRARGGSDGGDKAGRGWPGSSCCPCGGRRVLADPPVFTWGGGWGKPAHS